MSKIMSLQEAVAAFVRDGDTVAMEGFTHLIPFAAGHEIVRQRRRRLTLVRMTPDIVYDQLVGMGCAEKLVFSWGGNPGVGSLHRLRDAVEHGWPAPLEIEEHSHAAMAHAYAAGAAGMPCALFRGYLGSDLPAVNPNIRFVRPESGFHLWTDNMQIPVGAPAAFTAEKFIDFVYQPEVQVDITAYVNYMCPVKGVQELLAKKDPELAKKYGF